MAALAPGSRRGVEYRAAQAAAAAFAVAPAPLPSMPSPSRPGSANPAPCWSMPAARPLPRRKRNHRPGGRPYPGAVNRFFRDNLQADRRWQARRRPCVKNGRPGSLRCQRARWCISAALEGCRPATTSWPWKSRVFRLAPLSRVVERVVRRPGAPDGALNGREKRWVRTPRHGHRSGWCWRPLPPGRRKSRGGLAARTGGRPGRRSPSSPLPGMACPGACRHRPAHTGLGFVDHQGLVYPFGPVWGGTISVACTRVAGG